MAPIRSSMTVLAVSVLSLGALTAAQVAPVPGGQTRDGAPPPPTERRVPVGTSTVSGTVVRADTGRPIANARVSISGQVTQNMQTVVTGATRGGVIGAPGVGSAPPVGAAPPVVTTTLSGVTGQIVGGVGIAPAAPSRGGGSPSSLVRNVVTDANGSFSFPRMPAGQFMLSVSHNRYLPTNYGQRRAGGPGTYVQVTDSQQVTLKVPMQSGGIITGTVLGPDGEPQPRASVNAWRSVMTNGFKRLQTTGFASTDDRGVYRLFSLQPGEYVVSVTPSAAEGLSNDRLIAQYDLVERAIVSGQQIPPATPGLTPTVSVPVAPPPEPGQMVAMPSYLPTYAPSSMLASSATVIAIAGGEERTGVDVMVRLTQASSVQGSISTPIDANVGVQLTLLSDDPTINVPQGNSTRADPSGKFTFRGVGPGRYTVFAQTVPGSPVFVPGAPPTQPTPLTDSQKLWGRAQIAVAGEPTVNVNLSLRSARSISGIVLFDVARPPDLSRARATVTVSPAPSAQLLPTYGAPPQAQVGTDGRFTLTGVVPGRYLVRASGGGGALKSSIVAGEDTLDFPLEVTGERDITDVVITMSDKPSELSGVLTDASGKPAVDYTIVVAAAESRFWIPGSRRIALSRPAPDGRYLIRSLPPGAYVLAAVVDIEQGAQYDPEFLKSLSAAGVPITILEGGKVVQDLRVK